jgi:hypothetical protein
MARARTTLFDLVADDITIGRFRDQLDSLSFGSVSIDVAPRYMHGDEPTTRIAALERLSELALEVASELRTGRPDTDTTPTTKNS